MLYVQKTGQYLCNFCNHPHDRPVANCVSCGKSSAQIEDPVNHPKHYNSHPSGVECIQITEHMGFNLGNALKYIWRADEKGNAIEDLQKARWYIERELAKRTTG